MWFSFFFGQTCQFGFALCLAGDAFERQEVGPTLWNIQDLLRGPGVSFCFPLGRFVASPVRATTQVTQIIIPISSSSLSRR